MLTYFTHPKATQDRVLPLKGGPEEESPQRGPPLPPEDRSLPPAWPWTIEWFTVRQALGNTEGYISEWGYNQCFQSSEIKELDSEKRFRRVPETPVAVDK